MLETIMKVFIGNLHASSLSDLSQSHYYVIYDELFTLPHTHRWNEVLGNNVKVNLCGRFWTEISIVQKKARFILEFWNRFESNMIGGVSVYVRVRARYLKRLTAFSIILMETLSKCPWSVFIHSYYYWMQQISINLMMFFRLTHSTCAIYLLNHNRHHKLMNNMFDTWFSVHFIHSQPTFAHNSFDYVLCHRPNKSVHLSFGRMYLWIIHYVQNRTCPTGQLFQCFFEWFKVLSLQIHWNISLLSCDVIGVIQLMRPFLVF